MCTLSHKWRCGWVSRRRASASPGSRVQAEYVGSFVISFNVYGNSHFERHIAIHGARRATGARTTATAMGGQGHRAPSPTAAPPDCPERHIHTSDRPTGSGAPAPTSARLDVRPQRQIYTSSRPTGSGAPAPTSARPDVRHERQMHTSPRLTGSGAPAPT